MVGSAPGQLPSAGMRAFVLPVASLHVLLCSGEAFGWTALRPVLLTTGFFDESNPYKRDSQLNTVSTLGIAVNALCKLPLGIFLDRWGGSAPACLSARLPRLSALLSPTPPRLPSGFAAGDHVTTQSHRPALGARDSSGA